MKYKEELRKEVKLKMPKVGNKHFSYSKAGRAAAKKEMMKKKKK